MVRKSMLGLAAALALLWALGVGLVDRQAFILWFDLVAALAAGGIAVLDGADETADSQGVAPAALGIGMGVVWLVGLGSRQPRWAVWANFIAACACFGVAISAATHARRTLIHARH